MYSEDHQSFVTHVEDQGVFTCPCCPNASIVVPFRANPLTVWSKEDLRRSRFGTYERPGVESEFTRFMLRDCLQAWVLTGYTVVVFAFVVLFGRGGWTAVVYLAFGALCAICTIAAYVLHYVLDHTAFRAEVRHGISILVTFVAIWSMTFVTHPYNLDCFHGTGLGERRTVCIDRVDGSAMFAVVGILVFMRVKTIPAIVLGVLCPISASVSLFGLWRLPGPASVLALKVVILCIGAAIGGGISVVRDSIARRQFEQHVEVHIATAEVEAQRKNVDKLLSVMLPASVTQRLVNDETVMDTADGTVFRSDIVDFTKWAERRDPAAVVRMINIFCVKFDAATEQHGVEKVKTIGDAYWAVCGVPNPSMDHAENVLEFAFHVQQIVAETNRQHPEWKDIKLRIGIHSGEVNGGVLGKQQLSYEVFGDTNVIAEMVEQAGTPNEICVSSVTKNLLANVPDLEFRTSKVVEGPNGELLSTFILTRVLDAAPFVPDGQPQVRVLRPDDPTTRRRPSAAPSDRRVSSISLATGESIEEIRAITHSFISRRFQRANEAFESDLQNHRKEETTAEYVKKLTKYRYKYILYTYADSHVERDYLALTLGNMKTLQYACLASIAVILLFMVLSVISPRDDTDRTEFEYGALVMFLIAAAFLGVSTLATKDLFISFKVAPLLLGVCCALISSSVPAARKTVASNDPSWMLISLFVPYGLSMTWQPYPLTLLMLTVFIGIPLGIVTIGTAHFSGVIFAFIFLIIIAVPVGLIVERLQRQQFAEHSAAEFLHESMKAETQQYEFLLSSTVPAHIAPLLREWVHAGCDISKPLQQSFTEIAVAFFKFEPPRPPRQSMSGSTGSHPIPPALSLKGGNAPPTISLQPPFPAKGLTWEFMTTVQNAIEEELKDRKAIVKIKTVGNVTMVAGPIDFHGAASSFSAPHGHTPDAATVHDAAVELIEITKALRHCYRIVGDVRCGLHVGPAVGVVLGTDRMTFDVFGSTVNRAARALSVKEGLPTDVLATREFVKAFRGTADPTMQQIEIQSPLLALRPRQLPASSCHQPPVGRDRVTIIEPDEITSHAVQVEATQEWHSRSHSPPSSSFEIRVPPPTTHLGLPDPDTDSVEERRSRDDSASVISRTASTLSNDCEFAEAFATDMKGLGHVQLYRALYNPEKFVSMRNTPKSHAHARPMLPRNTSSELFTALDASEVVSIISGGSRSQLLRDPQQQETVEMSSMSRSGGETSATA